MPFLIALIVFLGIVALVRATSGKSVTSRAGFLKSGLEARGLVLSAARTGTDTSVNGQRFQVRSVVLDVEVLGRPPYELTLSPMFPRLCEPFPGAALDLRVDPRNPSNVIVVGPAGSSGWMHATAGLFPWAPSAGAMRSGCSGTVVVVVISLALAAGAVISFAAGGSDAPKPAPVPAAPTHLPPPLISPVSPRGGSELSSSAHPECDAAARCCKVLNRASCGSFAKLPEASCKAMLDDEKRAALKLHKTCE